jgi:hypothetical protein
MWSAVATCSTDQTCPQPRSLPFLPWPRSSPYDTPLKKSSSDNERFLSPRRGVGILNSNSIEERPTSIISGKANKLLKINALLFHDVTTMKLSR